MNRMAKPPLARNPSAGQPSHRIASDLWSPPRLICFNEVNVPDDAASADTDLRCWLIGALAFGLLGASEPAERDTLRATLACPQRNDPGRVVCDLNFSSVLATRSLVWIDALVISTPAFVQPLRSRVTTELPEQGSATAKLAIALISSELGRAELTVRARAVSCLRATAASDAVRDTPNSCTSYTRDVTAQVIVGR